MHIEPSSSTAVITNHPDYLQTNQGGQTTTPPHLQIDETQPRPQHQQQTDPQPLNQQQKPEAWEIEVPSEDLLKPDQQPPPSVQGALIGMINEPDSRGGPAAAAGGDGGEAGGSGSGAEGILGSGVVQASTQDMEAIERVSFRQSVRTTPSRLFQI